jgi:N-acetyl sugar amidotransferase
MNKFIYRVSETHQICTNCVMDSSDPEISFNEEGVCDYCNNYYSNILPNWHTGDEGIKLLEPILSKIKKEGQDHEHDCLIGISGGLDSSYVAYLAKEKFGLKPLLFHVDAGWNSQISTNNIHQLVDGLGLDLITEVINWQEMKDLQRSFFKAQVANIDIPQDLAFFAALYKFAYKNKFKYILTGGNYSTECVREPNEWGAYYPTDLRFVNDVHRKYGELPLKTYPKSDLFSYRIINAIKGIKVFKPLNYVSYLKQDVEKELAEKFNWQSYPMKHHESRFTRFVEDFWLPRKFGYDRRKAHLSSLILTKQMEREDVLERIKTSELDDKALWLEFEFVAKKLDFTIDEFKGLLEGENRTYRDYKNKMSLIAFATKMLRAVGLEKRVVR